MFIRELQVDGYGALQGMKLGLEAPVTVLYGANEAGKSTLLRFVRSMLYGFPTRKDPVERGEPVYGGRHGGRLLLSDTSDREWLLERYAQRGSGLVLRGDDGLERSMGQAEWERFMLGGISERLFRQLFSVSLNELHELRSLQGEEIGNYLYHAGLAGGSALTAARRRINTEMDKLYRPRGTTQEMNQLLAAIKETETAIRQSRDSVQTYNDTGEALLQVEHRLNDLENNLPALRMQTARIQGAYELREWWLKREALLSEEAELRRQLPDSSAKLLTEEIVKVWLELKGKRAETNGKRDQTRSLVIELRSLRNGFEWDEAFVNVLPEIERLESLREGMIARREEAAELEAERRMHDEAIHSTLSRLSANWGVAELLAFGGLAAEREQVRRLQLAWEEAERASLTLQTEARRLARQQEVVQAEAGNVTDNLHNKEPLTSSISYALPFGLFLPRTRSALLQAWHNVEDARRAYERSRMGSGTRPTREGGPRKSEETTRMLLAAACGLGLLALVLPFLVRQEGKVPIAIYGVSALLLLVSAGAVWMSFSRKSRQTAEAAISGLDSPDEGAASHRLHRRQVAERLRQLVNDPETAAAKLIPELTSMDSIGALETTFSTDPSEDEIWQQLREAVHQQLEQLEQAERSHSKQQELQGRIQELQLERELVERDVVIQQARLDALHSEWTQWLADRKLPAHLTPDSLPELLAMAEQGQAIVRQRQRVQDRIDTLRKAICEFEQSAALLYSACLPPEGIRTDALQAVQWLHRESARQMGLKEEAERVDRQLLAAEASVQEADRELASVEANIAGMLQEAQVDNEAAMEQRIRIDEHCSVLRKEAREIGIRLESGRDSESQTQLYELLRAYDEASLASLLNELKMKLAAEEQHRTELLDRRGRLAQELDRLRSEAEHEDKGQKLRELQSKLESLSERYAILAISDTLIVQTKAVFEEEKQPDVLQRSSRYLKQMTNGAYIRIVAPGDSPTLLAETSDRRLVDSAFLSRGTQEQLYLAMRFALCDAASPEHPLPLLLDDLFVHFDEQRLAQTIPVLEELALTRQVLLFTCHRHVAQTLADGIPAARILTLSGQAASGGRSSAERDRG
jgi:uncharacterized protein YhaN